MKKKYEKYLIEYGYSEKYSLEERICSCNITFVFLRDILLKVGNILEENLEENIYVASVRAGLLNGNNAIIVCGLENKKINMLGFAREGLIKQNTCKKALDRIEELLI